jgi:phenylalanyl-tRNA synthetase beta chain
MLFLKSWLEDYIDLSGLTNQQIADVITSKSSEVEEIKSFTDYFDGKVVLGRLQNIRKHPGADKLFLVDVIVKGGEELQIVTAATNIQNGDLVPVALEGCKLAGFTILSRSLRGELSQGMLCGKSDLLLEQYSDGVWVIENKFADIQAVLGQSIATVLSGFFPEETVFDVSILPNKIGVFGSYLGFAQELSNLLEEPQRLTKVAQQLLDPQFCISKIIDSNLASGDQLDFSDSTGITNNFCLFKIATATNEFDPIFNKRMFLTGINLIGSGADISNYLLYDIGQPNHFFSGAKLDKLSSVELKIDSLEIPTQFKGLGQLKNKILPIGTKVLLDNNNNILALPGVSGGEQTKVENSETDFVVEIANFDNQEIARSSFALKYRSEGGKIWTGGVNQALIAVCLVKLIHIFNSSNIRVLGLWDKDMGMVDSVSQYFGIQQGKKIPISIENLAMRLDNSGIDFWQQTIEEKLNFIGKYQDGYFYPELTYSNIDGKDDVFEELVRLIGFDKIRKNPIILDSNQTQNSNFKQIVKLKQIFVDFGCHEVILRPFVSPDQLQKPKQSLELIQPYRSGENFLRDGLLPTLAISLGENLLKGEKNPNIFEVNKVHIFLDGKKIDQYFAEVLITQKDPYLATSLVNKIIRSLDKNANNYDVEKADFTDIGPGYCYRTGSVAVYLVQLKKSFKKKYSIPMSKPVWWVKIDLTNWNYIIEGSKHYTQESNLPGISRSYSFIVDKSISWSKISTTISMLSLPDVHFSITPLERFDFQDDTDVVNFELDFESYIRNIDSGEIDSFEVIILSELNKLGPVSRR